MLRNKKLAPDAVLDEQGRQRFHGAFTGGFSAGHYNTVGSEEGFKPSTFVSSRANRASHKEQSANDFVDAEDGLLGGILSAQNEQVTFETVNPQSLAIIPTAKSDFFGIGYDPAVENPEIHASRGIASSKMSGQGVYRMDAIRNADSGPDYNSGTARSYSKHKGVAGFSMNDDEDDVYDSSILGIANKSSAVEQFESDGDGDDDYETTKGSSMRTKNTRKSSKQTINASVDNWLESTVGGGKVQQRCPTDRRVVLDGFSLAALEREIVRIPFPTPQAPKGFKPGHIFPEDLRTSSSSSSDSGRLVASRRMGEGGAAVSGTLLGETVHHPTQSTSVFDLIGEESRKKILSAINGRPAMQSLSSVTNMTDEQASRDRERSSMQVDNSNDTDQGDRGSEGKMKSSNATSRPMLTSDTLLKSTFLGLSQAFQNRFVSSSTTTADPVTRAGLASAEQYSAPSDVTPTESDIGSMKHTAGSTASTSHLVDLKSSSAQSKQAVLDKYSSIEPAKPLPLIPPPSLLNKDKEKEKVPVATTAALPVPLSFPSLCSAKTILKGKANRQSREWYPTPLLSRRFHIKVDGLKVGMKNGRVQGVGSGESGVDSRLESMFAGMRDKEKEKEKDKERDNTQVTSSHNSSSSSSSNSNGGTRGDSIRVTDSSKVGSDQNMVEKVEENTVEEVSVLVKPPMSLFKSIFEASDSDSDSDDSDEGEEEEVADKHEEGDRREKDMGDREGQFVNHSHHKTETVSQTIKTNKSSDIHSLPLTAPVTSSITNSDSAASHSAAVKSSSGSGGDYLRKRFGSDDRVQHTSLFNTAVPNPIPIPININIDIKTADSIGAELDAGKGKAGMKKMEVVVEEKEEEEEGGVTRVVFRKPVAKARVNAFGSKPKAKRTFSLRYEEDDEDGDKKDEEEGDNGVGEKDKDGGKDKVTEGMRFAGKVPVSKKRRVMSQSIDDDPVSDAMSESMRLILEMEEGVKEEVERVRERARARELERERDAANALAAGTFLSNMSGNKSSVAIQEAELAANCIIDAAEHTETETEELELICNIEECDAIDGEEHYSGAETSEHSITQMMEQGTVKEQLATSITDANTARDIGKKHHRDRDKKEKDSKKEKEKDKEKERKSKDKESKKKKKSSRLDESPEAKKDKKHKHKSGSKRSRGDADTEHRTTHSQSHSHSAHTVRTAVMESERVVESDKSSSSGGDSGVD